ncbi:MAG: hypothetical protein WCT46_06315 [Candidatus Gracilibacteria bacterium]|jgi:hypothetical protein
MSRNPFNYLPLVLLPACSPAIDSKQAPAEISLSVEASDLMGKAANIRTTLKRVCEELTRNPEAERDITEEAPFAEVDVYTKEILAGACSYSSLNKNGYYVDSSSGNVDQNEAVEGFVIKQMMPSSGGGSTYADINVLGRNDPIPGNSNIEDLLTGQRGAYDGKYVVRYIDECSASEVYQGTVYYHCTIELIVDAAERAAKIRQLLETKESGKDDKTTLLVPEQNVPFDVAVKEMQQATDFVDGLETILMTVDKKYYFDSTDGKVHDVK